MQELDDWQIEVIDDPSKYILICKGRQIGGTTTFAEKAVRRMMERPTRILVGSITEEQAKLVIVMVYDILCRENKKMIAKGSNKPTQDRIRLINGSEIRSRPVGTMGDSFRGFTADVNWLNEAAGWPELALIAIMPTLLTTGGDIWADSTPKGKFKKDGEKTWFYRSWMNENKKWKVYFKTSREVILERKITSTWTEERKQAMLKFLDDQKSEMPELLYKQEYEGAFSEEVLQFFDADLVMELAKLEREKRREGDHYIGADIGGAGKDPTIIVVGRRDDDEMYHTEMVTMKQKYTTEVSDMIKFLKRTWLTDGEYIDGAGIGWGVYSELINDDETRNSVVDLNASKKSISKDGKQKKAILQSDMYYNLKVLMERRKIFFLKDDNLIASLLSIQRDVGENGKEYFHGSNKHITEALVRLAWPMQQKSLKLKIYSIKV